MTAVIYLVAILPLLFYLVDGYYEKNILKGVYMILGFLSVMALVLIATKNLEWYYVCFVPVLIVFAVLYKIVKSK